MTTQGAVIEIPGVNFSSGAMRGRFSPRDGQLYVSGLKGWASAAVDDGCLQRVRYTALQMPSVAFRRRSAHRSPDVCQRAGAHLLAAAGRRPPKTPAATTWSSGTIAIRRGYGSPDLKVSDPAAEGHDEVKVRSATLIDGGRTVFLEIPNLQTG